MLGKIYACKSYEVSGEYRTLLGGNDEFGDLCLTDSLAFLIKSITLQWARDKGICEK